MASSDASFQNTAEHHLKTHLGLTEYLPNLELAAQHYHSSFWDSPLPGAILLEFKVEGLAGIITCNLWDCLTDCEKCAGPLPPLSITQWGGDVGETIERYIRVCRRSAMDYFKDFHHSTRGSHRGAIAVHPVEHSIRNESGIVTL